MQKMTGVINDPLGQPTVWAGNDFRLILKSWDLKLKRTGKDGRTDYLFENSDHYGDYGRPLGSLRPQAGNSSDQPVSIL